MGTNRKKSIIALCGMLAVFSACERFEPKAPEENTLLDGPVEGLSYAMQQQFLRGDVAFNDEVFTVETGLGPVFVATSCGSCHPGDGKGHPFTALTRFGQADTTGNTYLHKGGPQLQHRAIPGHAPEVIPEGATYSEIIPPANTGLGFIELVSDDDILRMSDPFDQDQDGISGRPHWNTVPGYVDIPSTAIEREGKYITRFGKKGAVFNLLQQTASAYNQDIGITSTFEPVDVLSGLRTDPEISDQTIYDVVAYLQMLKAPIQRDPNKPEVVEGRKIFDRIDCAKCHKPELKTMESVVEALSNKTFYPYTDLLLHDMGPLLDDGYTEGNALTSEWRTPPLWGLGLSKDAQGGQYYLMHDGRAGSIEEAIALHGGEADGSRILFDGLSSTEKKQLIIFLESL